MIDSILEKAERGGELEPAEIRSLLDIVDPAVRQALFDCARRVKQRETGSIVYFRGIIECSNRCAKDCFYCGIRRSNREVERFEMDEEEILREAIWAFDNEYGSVVIQAGERCDPAWIEQIERVVRTLKQRTGGQLGITLSLGEQSEETYLRWRAAGAHRYLLRIETSNAALYRKLHPADHDFEGRLHCLALLRKTGWQVGTGVMIGLPGQTTDDLANDVLFMKKIDVDMVGMGPYIPHRHTPLGQRIPAYTKEQKQQALIAGLKMIAVTRLVMQDINIAAATALQALDPAGREAGLRCGANIIMPNVTETRFRPSYTLYDNKPCLDENSSMCRGCLTRRIESIGETIGFNQWGDSPRSARRLAGISTPENGK